MTDKQIIIDGENIERIKTLLFEGQRSAISTKSFEAIIEALERKEQELNDYKKQFKADTQEMEGYQNEIVRHLESIEYWQHQAEAKEQECEKLKNWVKNMMFDTDRNDWFEHFAECFENWKKDLFKQLDQLKAENKDLQEQIRKHNDDMFKNPPEKRFYCKGCTLPYVSKKLKQTLIEIKELCNKTVCDYLQCSLNYNHSKDFECEKTSCNRAKRRKFILQILQKVSEVENE